MHNCSSAAAPSPASEPPVAEAPLTRSEQARTEVPPTEVRPTEAADPAARAQPPTGSALRFVAGPLRVGTAPGTASRRPSVEADLVALEIAAVDIDARPFPNVEGSEPMRVESRAEAARACRERGRRLCSELEWERACRGNSDSQYPTGAELPAECTREPGACQTLTGVIDPGLSGREWTASNASSRLARGERTVVVRGAPLDAFPVAHRCGARYASSPRVRRALMFRCCGGEFEAEYPDVGMRRRYRPLELGDAELDAMLTSSPALSDYRPSFALQTETDVNRALHRGDADEEALQWELASSSFAWSPSAGEEVWVVAGYSGESTILAAFYPLPSSPAGQPSFRHAASFIFSGERAPVALMHTAATREEIRWTTCRGCAGENGVIAFDREDATLVIAQR